MFALHFACTSPSDSQSLEEKTALVRDTLYSSGPITDNNELNIKKMVRSSLKYFLPRFCRGSFVVLWKKSAHVGSGSNQSVHRKSVTVGHLVDHSRGDPLQVEVSILYNQYRACIRQLWHSNSSLSRRDLTALRYPTETSFTFPCSAAMTLVYYHVQHQLLARRQEGYQPV